MNYVHHRNPLFNGGFLPSDKFLSPVNGHANGGGSEGGSPVPLISKEVEEKSGNLGDCIKVHHPVVCESVASKSEPLAASKKEN